MRKTILVILLTFLLACLFQYQAFATTKRFVIHTGSYSLDRHDLTQSEINNQVNAIVGTIPHVGYIAIGTYLDYPQQIRMWAQAIHKKHRKVFFRSAGFNSWQGRNGVPANGTTDQHRHDVVVFIQTNPDIFKSGDIFETVPDEPEGGTYWFTTYGACNLGCNPAATIEFNFFIQFTINDVNTAFQQLGINGVETNYVFTNPSAAKDVLDTNTANILRAIGTDDYPEINNGIPIQTATESAQAMHSEITNWLLPAHPGKSKHLTFGPNVYFQLTQSVQSSTILAELNTIIQDLPSYDGLTIWQAGANDNAPKSRLFDYIGSSWVPRTGAGTVETFFASH